MLPNIPHPIETDPTPDIDWTCQAIAEYLRDGLNAAYVPDKIKSLQRQKQRHLEYVEQGLAQPTSIFDEQIYELTHTQNPPTVVNGIRAYDAFNLPLHEFPYLKVYRSQDIYGVGKTVSQSSLMATYCLSLPNQEELQGSMRWVSWTINKLLLNPQINLCLKIQDGSIRAEYRTMLNEMVVPVYAFLRMYFVVKS